MNREAFTNYPHSAEHLSVYNALNEARAFACEPADIPPDALERFHELGREGEGVYIRHHEFIAYLRVDIDTSNVVYLAHCHKHDAADTAEEEIFVYEAEAGEQAGEGTVRLLRNAVFQDMADVPFVFYARSLPGYENDERDVRRLLLMNAASKQLFGKTVCSEDFRVPLGNSAWRTLQKAGLVERHKQSDSDRYRFIA